MLNNCSEVGKCIGPNECDCYIGFQGRSCEQNIGENLNDPIISFDSYVAEINSKFRGQIEYTLFYVVNLRFILIDRKEIVKFSILTKFVIISAFRNMVNQLVGC